MNGLFFVLVYLQSSQDQRGVVGGAKLSECHVTKFLQDPSKKRDSSLFPFAIENERCCILDAPPKRYVIYTQVIVYGNLHNLCFDSTPFPGLDVQRQAAEVVTVNDYRDFKEEGEVSQLLPKHLTMSLSLAEVHFLVSHITNG